MDCPGDNIGPQDLPATLWWSGWQATHEADDSSGSPDFLGEHWQTGGFSSAGDGQTITKTTSRQAQVNDVAVEAEDNWTIELQPQQ